MRNPEPGHQLHRAPDGLLPYEPEVRHEPLDREPLARRDADGHELPRVGRVALHLAVVRRPALLQLLRERGQLGGGRLQRDSERVVRQVPG